MLEYLSTKKSELMSMKCGNIYNQLQTISKITFSIIISAGLMFSIPLLANGIEPEIPDDALLPDLRAVVPTHLQIQNKQQHEILRFTNGIANVGPGNWQMAPEFPTINDQPQKAIQQFLDAEGIIVFEKVASSFEFHPEHHHWHIVDVVEFSVHKDAPDGILVGNSIKVTFCVIDSYNLDGNSPTSDRTYFECEVGLQGVQSGWADQYHQSTPGNQIDITGAEDGTYYLVHNVNPSERLIEENMDNNSAWTEFELIRHSNGNPKITITDNSCEPDEIQGLCGTVTVNRG